MIVIVVGTILGLILNQRSHGQISAGADAREFSALCGVLSWVGQTFNADKADWDDDSVYKQIMTLNMTMAPATWRQVFLKSGQTNEWETSPPAIYANNKIFQKMWADWAAAAKEVGEEKGVEVKLKTATGADTGAAELAYRRSAVMAITAEAYTVHNRLKELKRQKRQATPAVITNKINTIVLGKPDGKLPTDPKDSKSVIGGGNTAANRQTGCTSVNGQANPGSNLATISICLCANGASGSPLTNPCFTETAETTVAFPGGADQVGAKLEDLKKRCPTHTKKELTSGEVKQAANAIAALFRTTATGTYIGAFETTGCNGANNGGVCFKYPKTTTNTEASYSGAAWYTELQALAALLEADEKAEAQGDPILAHLTALAEQAQQIAAGELLQGYPNSTVPTAAIPAAGSQPSTGTKSRSDCSKHHSNQTECEKIECTYNENAKDGIKCKPKTGAETPAAAAGEKPKEGEAAAGCAKYGTKAECDADKTGDKQNCAWRKGKDNEDDKDKEKCRNGSFLVNKKFALSVVSAPFVALLF
uniref:Variant surface glycoprotein 1125.4300 n=1 Tax=Trypanosoma brucei TaxID=5691 RepID=A0A1J0RAJ7_9TRYP|nr:variant surface glycoprotein 1125.4300 [Trypanosoma brucei]